MTKHSEDGLMSIVEDVFFKSIYPGLVEKGYNCQVHKNGVFIELDNVCTEDTESFLDAKDVQTFVLDVFGEDKFRTYQITWWSGPKRMDDGIMKTWKCNDEYDAEQAMYSAKRRQYAGVFRVYRVCYRRMGDEEYSKAFMTAPVSSGFMVKYIELKPGLEELARHGADVDSMDEAINLLEQYRVAYYGVGAIYVCEREERIGERVSDSGQESCSGDREGGSV